MNLKSYLAVSVAAILVLSIISLSPLVDVLNQFGDEPELFSEFWLLDSNHATNDFPFNVTSGETYTFFVGVANYMRASEDYKVYVKLRNHEQYLLEYNSSEASASSAIHDFQFSLDNENVWESQVNFSFRDVSVDADVVTVGDIVVNGISKPVELSTAWDYYANCYYYDLFFELWRYEPESGNYKFDDLSVGLWLNMTAP